MGTFEDDLAVVSERIRERQRERKALQRLAVDLGAGDDEVRRQLDQVRAERTLAEVEKSVADACGD